MSCSDPDCPACRVTRLLEQFKSEGAGPGDVIPLFFAMMMEVWPDTHIDHIEVESSEVSVH